MQAVSEEAYTGSALGGAGGGTAYKHELGGRARPASPRPPTVVRVTGGSAHRPVCVLGMHRSGTSLAAGAVGAMGVDLGPSETMLPTNGVENTRGYFEQRAIRELNDDVLDALGGSWDVPPPLPEGWEEDPALEPLRARAAELYAAIFEGSDGRAGFKDPRLSLTLPFWRRVTGPLDCVVCLRPAAAVAASLQLRFRKGPQRVWPWHERRRRDWEALTQLYVASARHVTRGERRIEIEYDDWFASPAAQIDRLATFLGGVSAEGLERAAELVDPALRHHGARV